MMEFSKTKKNGTKTNIYIIILLSLLCFVPVISAVINWSMLGMPIHQIISLLIIAIAIFSLPFLFFKTRVAFLINIPYILLSPLELFSLFYYKSPLKEGQIMLILQTNLQESFEFLMSYKLFIIIYLIVIGAYLFIAFSFVKNEYVFSYKKRILLSICVIISFLGMYAYCAKMMYNSANDFQENIKQTNKIYKLKFKKIYPCNVYLSMKLGCQMFNEYKIQNDSVDSFLFHSTPKFQTDEKEIYVFVIGETARYTNFSINGYARETTPLLAKTDNILSFSDVFTQANLTFISLRMLLTRSTDRKSVV